MYKKVIILFYFSIFTIALKAQFTVGGNDSATIDFSAPKEYEIGGITVAGSNHLDQNILILLSGLSVGDKVQVPGDKFSTAIENLWKQGLFEDVKITATKIQGSTIFINITVLERPRLSKYFLKGLKKGEVDDLREKIKLIKGKVLTDGLVASTLYTIKEFFTKKGYMDVKIDIKQEKDEQLDNSVTLTIDVNKGNKTRIKDINIIGASSIEMWRLRRTFHETKRRRWWNPFNSGKFDEGDFETDKKSLIAKYNSKGFRDARIVKDTMYRVGIDRVSIDIYIDEGHKYYFRNITWLGNSKYTNKDLDRVFGVKKGDIYDQSLLDTKLFMNPAGNDVSSLYMDDGYLFFNVTPVETMVTNDSIDFEMHIYEGKQAVINKITIVGNTKTNDHVILREIRTKPGQLFRRADVIRTQSELSRLGYFNPQKINITPTPNPLTGKVDIEYSLEEKPSDQIELSGGYGNGRLLGTLGVTFSNFSAKNFFKKESWRPLPSGDGERLSVRAQSSGPTYQSYNASFTEPWLGGKAPHSLTFSTYYSVQSNGAAKDNPNLEFLHIRGTSIGLGRRLKWPDDYFTLQQELAYEYYTLHNYTSLFTFNNGYSNNIFYKFTLQRNSVDKPIFETRGSKISFTAQLTPPYSLFSNKDYSSTTLSEQARWKFDEYQRYKFSAKYFTSLTNKQGSEGKAARNLVLMTSAAVGLLGQYNSAVGSSPFERFYLGGSGLTGYSVGGREVIALRGYDAGSMSSSTGAAYIVKYSMELRFPIVQMSQATAYVLGFIDAGNSWNQVKDFDPFNVYRGAGTGVRIFLPMFGLLGLDYGWRLDTLPTDPTMQKGQFFFTIGATIGDL